MLPRSIILALTLIKMPGKANASAPYLVCGKWNFHPYPFSLVQQLRLSKINKYVYQKQTVEMKRKLSAIPLSLHSTCGRDLIHDKSPAAPAAGAGAGAGASQTTIRQQLHWQRERRISFALHSSNRALKERNNSPAVMTTCRVVQVRLRIQDILA